MKIRERERDRKEQGVTFQVAASSDKDLSNEEKKHSEDLSESRVQNTKKVFLNSFYRVCHGIRLKNQGDYFCVNYDHF